MTIEVQWLNSDKQFILLHFTNDGIDHWDEYNTAVDTAWALANEVDHNVVAVFAAYDAKMPAGSPLSHIKRAVRNVPPNVCLSISIVERTFEKMMIDMIADNNLADKIQTVASWGNANQFLEKTNLPLIPLEDVPPRK